MFLLPSTYVYYVITKILPSRYQKAPRNHPFLPHPATMTPTALALALATATSAFLPIAGQPNDNDLCQQRTNNLEGR